MQNDLMITNPDTMNSLITFSNQMATAKTVLPDHLKNRPGDCMAIAMQAMRWGMDPFVVASKTHIVNNNIGYEAQLISAVVSSSTAIEGGFSYEYSHEDWASSNDPKAWVKVGAVRRGESKVTWGQKVYPSKQIVKNSPLWKTDPVQQCTYLAIKKWCRLYTPAVILGVYTPDELQGVSSPSEIDVTPKYESVLDLGETVNVDVETGEIAEDTAAKPTVNSVIGGMSACETIEELHKKGKELAAMDHFSNEEMQTLRSSYAEIHADLKPTDNPAEGESNEL